MNHPSFSAPALETLNSLLPAFEFKALIAANHLGAVYLAKQRSLDRDVAIKILAPHVSSEAKFVESFQTTARTMARLNHPNLIGVYDSGIVDGMLYFVMEFVPGKSLERSSQGQRVEFATAARLVEGIADGLSHAHAHGIIHGNLNPANILLNQKAEPKIGNFGFSHPTEAPADSGSLVASDSFTAPEVAAAHPHIDQRSDIFSLGAILYQLLTGTPHAPDAPPPSKLGKCPAGIDAIWSQATHPDPAQRYPDMRSFRVALTDLLKNPRSVIATGPPASQRLAVPATPPDSQRLGARPVVPATSSPPGTAPVKQTHVGINWKLIRNLFIIAGLLYAISLAWDNYKNTKARREKENREAVAKAEADKQKAQEEARKRKLNPGNGSSQTGSTTPSPAPDRTRPDPAPAGESPAASLARLRNALFNGDREEMPVGSVRQGACDYFLVTEAMTWPEASWFAERHGGHLAIPNAGADLTWLVKNVTAGNGVWIGAGRSGRSEWTLVDGLSWQPKKEPGGTGTYLSADKHGFLVAAGAKEKLPFVIQWHRDGKNPGTLSTLLANTRESIAKGKPVFPPGTRAFENRFYLYIAKPLMWREAVDLAESAGGHLAVTSETAEIAHVSQLADDIHAPEGIWLGGFRKGDQWVWITGEPWKSAKWIKEGANDFPDSALIHYPGKGWDACNLSEQASGCIIEWSNDRKNQPAPTPGSTAGSTSPSPEIAALTTRAKDLIAAADRKRTEQLVANSRRMPWDLDIYLRNSTKSDQAIWGVHVNRLKASITNNRVPASIPKSSGIQLSQKMAEICQASAVKQEQIDTEFLAEAEKIRSAFVTKVRDAATKAEQAGQRALAQSLGETLNAASNLDDWLRSLGVEAKPANPVVAAEEKPRLPGSFLIPIPRNNGGNDNPLVE
jgi:serine/threonine protein kinase